jgi:hypothetical protein
MYIQALLGPATVARQIPLVQVMAESQPIEDKNKVCLIQNLHKTKI